MHTFYEGIMLISHDQIFYIIKGTKKRLYITLMRQIYSFIYV